MLISIVSPVYKGEKMVDELVRRLVAELSRITNDFEIILVEDCGPDNSWERIEGNCRADNRVKGIKFSKNFGQHHAITAGLDYCKGEWVVVMDCDLQDRPEEIINLYNKAQEGYDIVLGQRIERKHAYMKKLASNLFYKGFSYLSGIEQDRTISNFGIYHRKVIDVINQMREPMRGFAPMISWVGFRRAAIPVKHSERFDGKSSYNWSRLLTLGLSIAISYSDKPLFLVIKLGLLISALSVLYSIYTAITYFSGIITVSGYTSIIISIWFLSGLIIFILGVLGLYIGKIFEGVKERPLYIVQKIENI